MEMLDIVDENDNVVGSASQKEIYEKLLPHRIAHVLVFNERGEMALQMRSATKGFCPLHWSTTAGGHVQSGETYEQAALREMQEELGVTATLEELGKDLYVDKNRGLRKFLATFKAIHPGPFNFNHEVERVEFFGMEKIRDMVVAGEKFHPELMFLLEKRFGIKRT